MISIKQKQLIKKLQEILSDINNEAIDDDEFYTWLNKNYFFEENLEDIIIKIKNVL